MPPIISVYVHHTHLFIIVIIFIEWTLKRNCGRTSKHATTPPKSTLFTRNRIYNDAGQIFSLNPSFTSYITQQSYAKLIVLTGTSILFTSPIHQLHGQILHPHLHIYSSPVSGIPSYCQCRIAPKCCFTTQIVYIIRTDSAAHINQLEFKLHPLEYHDWVE